MAVPPAAPRKVIPIKAVPITPEDVSLYEAQKTIHTRSIGGVFSRWRWALVWLTQLVFYGLPWLPWGERQAVLFDLEARRFYIFNLVLYPQDFIYLTALLVISALSLFLFTAVAGRLWCGFSCPQTVYTEIFMWIEHRIEGDRSARLRLDGAGWNAEKIGKRGFKHVVWLSVALWTGFTFVGYFTPIRSLATGVATLGLGPWEWFWVLFYGFATYGNAGFLREQVCKYMCPYARFQSAMFDRDTLIVTYDAKRGETRGARKKGADTAALGLGDCVDCTLCVQVCPTGIDIRDGLQYECIGCGLCIDACNMVMDKMQYPQGLIRLSTQNGVDAGWTAAQMRRRVFRPRVLIYGAILTALCIALLTSLVVRNPFKVDVVRDRAGLARIVAGGKLENVYRLQIMNATEKAQSYRITVRGLDGLVAVYDAPVEVGAAQSRWVAVRLQLPYGSASAGSHPVYFDIEGIASPGKVAEKSAFIVPR